MAKVNPFTTNMVKLTVSIVFVNIALHSLCKAYFKLNSRSYLEKLGVDPYKHG